MTISPLAPTPLSQLPAIRGVRLAAIEAGVRYQGRKDVMLMHFETGSVCAGVFTQSATRSAPVLHSQAILGNEGQQGFLILANSGNSNAFTGKAGFAAMEICIDAAGATFSLPPQSVHMASTGVIGEVLPSAPIVNAIPKLAKNLHADSWVDAAKAIMTTDTFAKGASREVDLGVKVTLTGIAKGSGMIAPNMATMLGFLATDAKISQALLQAALLEATDASFNAITVDSDTSTSDSVYLGATGQAEMEPITQPDDPRYQRFKDALKALMIELAQAIVKDGEGATKFVEIQITGAQNHISARQLAMAIGNSPLVKTAIAGEDPNWGRIIAAIGKAGEPAERDKITISFGDIRVAENGAVSPHYTESQGAQYMKNQVVIIKVDLGIGGGQFTTWTCDLTKRYIEINADYRS